jgi:TPR repeat protein
MFEQGSDKVGAVPQDLLQAARLYERACNANDACACVNLADLYLQGRGVKKDKKRGAALRKKGYRSGCDPRE